MYISNHTFQQLQNIDDSPKGILIINLARSLQTLDASAHVGNKVPTFQGYKEHICFFRQPIVGSSYQKELL